MEIRSILKAFRGQSELQSLSSDEAKKRLEGALKKVHLTCLADQIRNNVIMAQEKRSYCTWVTYAAGALASFFMLAFFITLIYHLVHQEKRYEEPVEPDTFGLVGIDRKTPNWIKGCPITSNYTHSLVSLDRAINLYGITQVEDEIGQCGGPTDERAESSAWEMVNGGQ